MLLSGSYWRRQLVVAKEARRVDILCHRIYVSYRLLEGTSCHKELHDIIEDAKAKLECEVGPLDGMSAKMARGIVSRLSGGSDILKLCSLAIQRADEWLSSPDLHLRGNDLYCHHKKNLGKDNGHLILQVTLTNFLCRFVTCCMQIQI
jgi:hypothetical protein